MNYLPLQSLIFVNYLPLHLFWKSNFISVFNSHPLEVLALNQILKYDNKMSAKLSVCIVITS